MAEFKISQFTQKVQEFIKENSIDRDGDNIIKESNGELANLLSGMNANNVEELLMTDTIRVRNTQNTQSRITPSEMEELAKLIQEYHSAMNSYNAQTDETKKEIRENAVKEIQGKYADMMTYFEKKNNMETSYTTESIDNILDELSKLSDGSVDKIMYTLTNHRNKLKANLTNIIETSTAGFSLYDESFTALKGFNDDCLGGNKTLDVTFEDISEEYLNDFENTISNVPWTKALYLLREIVNKLDDLATQYNNQIENKKNVLMDKYQKNYTRSKDSLCNNKTIEQNGENVFDLDPTGIKAFINANDDYKTTDVNTVQTQNTKNGKFMENGQIVIYRDGVKYNLQGKRLD